MAKQRKAGKQDRAKRARHVEAGRDGGRAARQTNLGRLAVRCMYPDIRQDKECRETSR